MVAISANAILLLAAITDFLRESVVYLKQSILKATFKAGIGKETIIATKAALDSAATELRRSISDAVHFRALEKDRMEKDDALLSKLSDMDFKKYRLISGISACRALVIGLSRIGNLSGG